MCFRSWARLERVEAFFTSRRTIGLSSRQSARRNIGFSVIFCCTITMFVFIYHWATTHFAIQHIKNHPNTLLSRYYGLHRVKLPRGKKIYFVVMGNVFPPNKDIHDTFDLKVCFCFNIPTQSIHHPIIGGRHVLLSIIYRIVSPIQGSLSGREISAEEIKNKPRVVMKDVNWLILNRRLYLGEEKRRLLTAQLESDVKFLMSMRIMDYSLLTGMLCILSFWFHSQVRLRSFCYSKRR